MDWNWVAENKEWIFSGIGIPLITAVFTVFALTVNRWRLRDKHNDLRLRLVGQYYTYHIRTTGDDTIVRGVMKICKSLSVKLTSGDCEYNGYVEYRAQNLFFRLVEAGGREVKTYSMYAPFKNDFEVISGVFCCLTNQAKPVAGKKVLIKMPKREKLKSSIVELSEENHGLVSYLKNQENTAYVVAEQLPTGKTSEFDEFSP